MDSRQNTSSEPDLVQELDPVQQEAIGWVVRLTSGEATQEDAERLALWRARSVRHEEAFRLASLTWRQSAGARATSRPAVVSRRLFLAGAGTGAALAASWAGVSLGILPGPAQLLSDYATGVGEQAHFQLPDGSLVDLDGASALDVKVTSQTRTARLVSGAAAFDVHADGRPFQVTAGSCDVRANDAAFALTTGAGVMRIECTRGDLEVAEARRGPLRLRAGERLVLADGQTASPEPMDPASAAPWRRGLLVFEDRPFAEVVEDINRHRRGRVVLARPGLGDRRVDGVFHLDRPDEIVTNLAALLRLRETWLPGGIVVLT